ncbi:FadR/GntR family transcriptional regulator [Streptomyces collinus]|uniref:FadR/GntR family transcriptional regulator n=1 Tax=Streptomyces collinus TaxID=42684 RepID=UPI0036A4CEC9
MDSSDNQTPNSPPFQRITAAEAILSHLRRAVERRDYIVGDRLPSEVELARTFTVSRSVVRGALRAMDSMGLTVTRPGRGTYVASNGPVDSPVFGEYCARDICEVRRRVEIPMAGYAALRRSSADARELSDLIDQMQSETDLRSWVSLDTRFHIAVAAASANPVYRRIIEELSDAIAGQSMFLNALDGERRKQSNYEHRAIVEAIGDGADHLACRAMERHLDQVESTLIKVVQRNADEATKQGEERS